MKNVDINNLLDLDELNQSQQEYIKSLIKISNHSTDKTNLTFEIKGTHFGYRLVDGEWTSDIYKHIMYHLLERYALPITDLRIREEVKEILTTGPRGSVDRNINRPLFMGDLYFSLGDELNITSQNLFRATQIVVGVK